jgi:hypothetical protein
LKECIVDQMHEEEVIFSTNTRKRRLKSSFGYSTMKQLEKAREYRDRPNGIALILVMLQEH